MNNTNQTLRANFEILRANHSYSNTEFFGSIGIKAFYSENGKCLGYAIIAKGELQEVGMF